MPETAEAQKINGHEYVPGKTASEAPINDDPRIDLSLSPYYKVGWRTYVNQNFNVTLVKMWRKILIMQMKTKKR